MPRGKEVTWHHQNSSIQGCDASPDKGRGQHRAWRLGAMISASVNPLSQKPFKVPIPSSREMGLGGGRHSQSWALLCAMGPGAGVLGCVCASSVTASPGARLGHTQTELCPVLSIMEIIKKSTSEEEPGSISHSGSPVLPGQRRHPSSRRGCCSRGR